MGEKNSLRAHVAFGDTNRADGVPDCSGPGKGPVYLEGRLVLALSFQGTGEGVRPFAGADEILERYRLWDDLSGTWRTDDLEVLRFEYVDVVVRSGPKPVVLWKGAVDTRARVVPVPDLDCVGMAVNRKCDLRWKRV